MLQTHGATEVDDAEPVAGDVAFDASPRAAQLSGGLVEGEQQGVGCGRGQGAGVRCGLHVSPKCGDRSPAITKPGGRGGRCPISGGRCGGRDLSRPGATHGRRRAFEPFRRRRRPTPLSGKRAFQPVCPGHAVYPICAPVGVIPQDIPDTSLKTSRTPLNAPAARLKVGFPHRPRRSGHVKGPAGHHRDRDRRT